MQVTRFTFLSNFCSCGYKCNRPGDQSGAYVSAEKVIDLLDVAKEVLPCLSEEFAYDVEDPRRQKNREDLADRLRVAIEAF